MGIEVDREEQAAVDEMVALDLPEAGGLWAALLRAQESFPAIVRGKTATVPTRNDGSYSYAYADLGDILREVGPILRAQGLVLTQPIVWLPGGAAIRTVLVHAPSGEREVSEFPLPMEGSTAQQVGSLITYWRRYSAQAMLGITTESDSDAQDVNVPRRSQGRSSAPRGRSGGSGGARSTKPSLGVLWGDLKNLASTLEGGAQEEWDDWKAEHDWARIMAADEGKLVESKRDVIVAALTAVRAIKAGEAAAAGAEPWSSGDGEDADPVTGTDWEDDGPYG